MYNDNMNKYSDSDKALAGRNNFLSKTNANTKSTK